MIAAGIDLGGSKSEVQLFDESWICREKRREPTPKTYEGMLVLIANQIDWARHKATKDIPVGLGIPGFIDANGLALMANLPASGKPLLKDINRRVDSSLHVENDCRSFTLSEAHFGAGRSYDSLIGLILGTGVGGGHVFKGKLVSAHSGLLGEYGHIPLPYSLASERNLPLWACGCGRTGCYETLLSGQGLGRWASMVFNEPLTSQSFKNKCRHDPKAQNLWNDWCVIAAHLLLSLIISSDPQAIIIGGGLSRTPDLIEDLKHAMDQVHFPLLKRPQILLAEGGDASGARGAAYAAWQHRAYA